MYLTLESLLPCTCRTCTAVNVQPRTLDGNSFTTLPEGLFQGLNDLVTLWVTHVWVGGASTRRCWFNIICFQRSMEDWWQLVSVHLEWTCVWFYHGATIHEQSRQRRQELGVPSLPSSASRPVGGSQRRLGHLWDSTNWRSWIWFGRILNCSSRVSH